MSRHVFKKGMAYFKKHGFRKACKRTIFFFTEKNSYKKLLKRCAPTPEELQRQRDERFEFMPKVSILIPMYNTPINFFKELIECVQAQTYSNWELCLADGTGKDTESSDYAIKLSKLDSRIVYKRLASNDGISENTNRALELATGEFIALMDHDDVITEDALYYLVKAINDDPLADSVYSDEDKMDMEGGKLFEPHFKPDFNIDYLRCCNYICHMFMTRTSIAREVGGFRKEFDGAQDFDFIFRCTEKSRHVAHVPRVLYHWRCHINSTAAVPESKMYAYNAGVASIAGHFERTGIAMKSDMGESFGYYKVASTLTEAPNVCVICHGDKSLIENISGRLSNMTYKNLQWITCDSTPRAINEAVKKALINNETKYLLFLDARINKVSDDLVEALMGYAIRKDVVGAGARIIDSKDQVFHTFFIMGTNRSIGQAFRQLDESNTGYYMRARMPQDVSGIGLFCLLLKTDAWEAVDGLDEAMSLVYGAADLCIRIRSLNDESKASDKDMAMWRDKYKFVYAPQAVAHINCVAEDNGHSDREDEEFSRKWPNLLKTPDMYYNVNLTKRDTNFAILSSMELKGEDL